MSTETGILIAPTLHYGVGLPCDKFYAGSASIQCEDLNNTLSQLLSWRKLQDFQKFFVITAHGDPFHLQALRTLKQDKVFVLELYDIPMSGILERQQSAQHACEAETSVLLYLFPDKVRKEKLEDFEMPFEEFKDYLNHVKEDAIPHSPGCQGYPSLATREKGKKIVAGMKGSALEWIQKHI